MDYKTLILEIDERKIATLTLNRPDVHNAMSLEMIRELRKVVGKLNADSEIRAVIMSGSGKSFCAGADLCWMQEIAGQKSSEPRPAAANPSVVTNRTGISKSRHRLS